MIDRIFGRLAEIINLHPRRVAAFIGIIFIVALYGMTLITMETGNDTYLNKDSPEGILNKHYTDTFSSNALILIVETSDPLSPQVISYIDRLERDISQQENVVGSASIAGFLKSANGGILPQSKGEIDQIVARIPPEVKETAVPSNVLTLVQITLSQGLSEEAKSATLKNVESLLANNGPPPGVKITVSGSTAFSGTDEERDGFIHGRSHWRCHGADGHRPGYIVFVCQPPLPPGAFCGHRPDDSIGVHGAGRYPAQYGGARRFSGDDRSWYRLRYPVPCTAG